MLIIPHQVGAVLVPEYCKWSDVVLHISSPVRHIKDEDGVWLKASSQTPAGLNCLLTDGDTKKSSEAGRAQGHASFF